MPCSTLSSKGVAAGLHAGAIAEEADAPLLLAFEVLAAGCDRGVMWRASTMTRCIAAAVAISSGRGPTSTAQHTAQHTQTQAYGAGGVGLGAASHERAAVRRSVARRSLGPSVARLLSFYY